MDYYFSPHVYFNVNFVPEYVNVILYYLMSKVISVCLNYLH